MAPSGPPKKFRESCVAHAILWYNINMEGMDLSQQLKTKESYHERQHKVHL